MPSYNPAKAYCALGSPVEDFCEVVCWVVVLLDAFDVTAAVLVVLAVVVLAAAVATGAGFFSPASWPGSWFQSSANVASLVTGAGGPTSLVR